MAALNDREESCETRTLSGGIMGAAAELNRGLSGRLHVLHTYLPTSLGTAAVNRHLNLARESEEAVRIEDCYRREHLEAVSRDYGVPTERVHVEMGAASRSLTSAVSIHHADIMVMGAFSRATWRRLLIGSTLSLALESLPCDLVVVKAAAPSIAAAGRSAAAGTPP